MDIDVRSLGTFNRLAREGAEQATRSMARMTGIDAEVEVTSISLVDRADVGEELGAGTFVGVRVGCQGALDGETVLVFDADSADRIEESLLSGDDDPGVARSGVEEIGNVMTSGFVDGWADYLGETIEQTPPEYIERSGSSVLPSPESGRSEQVFVFRNEIEWLGESVSFYIYMLPAYDPIAELLADHADADGDAIAIEKLEVFNRMTRQGAETAAENVEAMTGIPTEAEVSRLSFSPIEDVPGQIGDETVVGTVVEFTGTPSGYFLVLFDEQSAVTVAEALLPVATDGDGLTDRHEAAIEELGNIVTSGFVDGWANVLQRPIDHTPPRLVHDMGRAVVDPLAARLGRHQRHAFVVDSRMQTDRLAFECEVYALPDEAELREALEDLLIERADQTEADADRVFDR